MCGLLQDVQKASLIWTNRKSETATENRVG